MIKGTFVLLEENGGAARIVAIASRKIGAGLSTISVEKNILFITQKVRLEQ